MLPIDVGAANLMGGFYPLNNDQNLVMNLDNANKIESSSNQPSLKGKEKV